MNKLSLNSLISYVFLLVISLSVSSQNSSPIYLNPNASIESRVNDLMSRMTIEDKVYQMNQFVGLDHMRQAEKNLTEEELHSNDAQGFYKGVFSKDVAEMTRRGEIGSFLHVLTPEESNLLQKLAMESKLKIPLLIGIDAIHGNALVSGTTVYPSPITLAFHDGYLLRILIIALPNISYPFALLSLPTKEIKFCLYLKLIFFLLIDW